MFEHCFFVRCASHFYCYDIKQDCETVGSCWLVYDFKRQRTKVIEAKYGKSELLRIIARFHKKYSPLLTSLSDGCKIHEIASIQKTNVHYGKFPCIPSGRKIKAFGRGRVKIHLKTIGFISGMSRESAAAYYQAIDNLAATGGGDR